MTLGQHPYWLLKQGHPGHRCQAGRSLKQINFLYINRQCHIAEFSSTILC
uniref:Uncharacterized protein n=1 Tax=Arundo donax TaxID=35708 RepID=A0A0A9C7U7_ARUDO